MSANEIMVVVCNELYRLHQCLFFASHETQKLLKYEAYHYSTAHTLKGGNNTFSLLWEIRSIFMQNCFVVSALQHGRCENPLHSPLYICTCNSSPSPRGLSQWIVPGGYLWGFMNMYVSQVENELKMKNVNLMFTCVCDFVLQCLKTCCHRIRDKSPLEQRGLLSTEVD